MAHELHINHKLFLRACRHLGSTRSSYFIINIEKILEAPNRFKFQNIRKWILQHIEMEVHIWCKHVGAQVKSH